MKSFASEIAQRLARMRPMPEDMLQGHALLAAHGRAVGELERFCREWSMDRAVADGMRDTRHSNVAPFPQWLRERLEDPYLVPLSRLVAARRRHGVDMALDGFLLRWPQEVAWANLCRLVADPETACLAQAWLKAARADPGKSYLLLLDALSAIDDPSYLGSAARELSPETISALPALPQGFTPAWRRMSSGVLENGIRRQGEGRVAAMAATIRKAAQREERLRTGARFGRRLEAECPHMRISVLATAAEMGLVSDELLAAFHALVEAARLGTLQGMAHHVLALNLASHIGTAEPLDEHHTRLRIAVVSSLGPTWLHGMPRDWETMMDGRAASPSTAGVWASQVEQGIRRPPLDPMLDYGLWLAERRG